MARSATRRGREGTTAPSRREKAVPHLSATELLAWRGLLETEARLIPLLDEELRRHGGMSVNEFDVLYQLWTRPERRARMKDLAAAVLVTPGGITRLVGRLAERGWVARRGSEGIQAVEAELTVAGVRALERALDVHFDGVRREFVSRLSREEVRMLAAIWERLQAADADVGKPPARRPRGARRAGGAR